jgi:hypothetical protein
MDNNINNIYYEELKYVARLLHGTQIAIQRAKLRPSVQDHEIRGLMHKKKMQENIIGILEENGAKK